jgi:small neutral amino acid transporter SnatA (MarC family)
MRSVGGRVGAYALVLVAATVLVFGIAAPPERCPRVTSDELRASAIETVDWFARNQQPDGAWLYEYDRDDDRAAADYNDIRHAGVVESLYQAATDVIPGALESADRGTEYALDHLVTGEDWAGFSGSTVVSTGSNALLVAGLVERRSLTGDDRYDDVIAKLANLLARTVEPSGAVLAYFDTTTGQPIPNSYSKYYTGETYWALARLHRLDPDAGWGELADRVGHYLATTRDGAEDLWPPTPDHWAGYGLAETVAFPERQGSQPLTEAELAYVRRQAGLFGAQVRFVSQRVGPWGELVRTRHLPRGGGYGVLGEGLTGLWIAANADERLADLRTPIAERTVCNAALALLAQSDAVDAARFHAPARVEGAWFRDGVTRMDDQQHALSAVLRSIAVVEAGVGGSGRESPAAWLWLLALVLALNPCRQVFGAPRSGRSRREVVEIAALGSLLGALPAVVAALVSGWLLDTVGVSGSSMRIAAGIVALVAGAFDLFRRPPSPDPALSGWKAAIVPVAIPLVARPALIFLAFGAVADHSVWLVLLGLVLGIGAFVALVATAPVEGVGGRVLRWAARLSAVGLIAISVLLIVNGVLDV